MRAVNKLLWVLAILWIAPIQLSSQAKRFTDPGFFSKSEIVTDTGITYGVAMDWQAKPDTQKFNISYPALQADALKKRPFVLLFHGGGYHAEDEFSNRNQWDPLCLLLAQRGFVAATVDYRVGWEDHGEHPDDRAGDVKKVEPTSVLALYRALQDARAALRYFVSHAAQYGIDTNNIFIGGRSAGGDISLWTAFTSERELDSLCMNFIPGGCRAILGSLDSSTNAVRAHYKIRGVINMWGPIADTSFISDAEAHAIPIIMFHGVNDEAVPYKKFAPPEYPYTRYGSYYIAARYRHLGACYELNTKTDGGHGEDFYPDFLAAHIAAFLDNVMKGSCVSAEYESNVSLKWKVELFFKSGAWINLLPVVAVLILTFFLIRRRRRKKAGGKSVSIQ